MKITIDVPQEVLDLYGGEESTTKYLIGVLKADYMNKYQEEQDKDTSALIAKTNAVFGS